MKVLVNRSRSTTVGNDASWVSFSRRYLKQTQKELKNSDSLAEFQYEYLTDETGMRTMVFEQHGWKIGLQRDCKSNDVYNCKIS